MLEFEIKFQLREFEIAFKIQDKDDIYIELECALKAYQLSSSLLTLELLYDLLQKQIVKVYFSLEDLELKIMIPIGKKTIRYIYLPVLSDNLQKNRIFLMKSMERLENTLRDLTTNAIIEKQLLAKQYQKRQNKYQAFHDNWHEKKCASRSHEQQIAILIQEDLKLNRQIINIDQEIMSCKRGVDLEQYRTETNSQNRQQRKIKVYLSELSKISNPKIYKIMREKCVTLIKLDLQECELKSMKFVQIFELLQKLKLSKNFIRKIQGLTTLTHLRKVELEGNVIQKIQGFNNNLEIRQIKLQHNRIAKLQNVFHLCRLQILALSQNLMEDIPRQIKMLEGLIQLRLINNNINHLPGELLTLNKLRILSITGNPCLKDNHRAKELLKKLATAQVEVNSAIL